MVHVSICFTTASCALRLTMKDLVVSDKVNWLTEGEKSVKLKQSPKHRQIMLLLLLQKKENGGNLSTYFQQNSSVDKHLDFLELGHLLNVTFKVTISQTAFVSLVSGHREEHQYDYYFGLLVWIICFGLFSLTEVWKKNAFLNIPTYVWPKSYSSPLSLQCVLSPFCPWRQDLCFRSTVLHLYRLLLFA